MEVGEIFIRTGRSFEWFHVRLQLNQVSRYKPCSETEISQKLNKEPCRVSTRAARQIQGFFGCLDARLQSNHISNFALQSLIQVDEKIGDSDFLPLNRGK